jgi:hypothetical protein
MEEFDLNFDTNIGTSVSKLKNNTNNNSDTDIDYDKLLDNLNASETNDRNTDLTHKPSNNNTINMNHFAKKLENKLDNIKKERDREMFVEVKRPPVKMNVDSIKLAQPQIKPLPPVKKPVEESNLLKQFEHKDIIIYVVLFIILNSKLIIELIYDKIAFTQNKPYPNLIIRGIIFGGILFLIKKFNLNS